MKKKLEPILFHQITVNMSLDDLDLVDAMIEKRRDIFESRNHFIRCAVRYFLRQIKD